MVMAVIVGTLVGGSSTIGIAQLAFTYGISAWWFTIGGGLSCLLLGLFLAGPLRRSGLETIPQFLETAYGSAIAPVSSVFTATGMFFAIISQVLSAEALLTSMLGLAPVISAVVAVLLIISYVFFGGFWGAGVVGIAKVALLSLTLLVTGGLSYSLAGGISGLRAALPAEPFFSIFARGAGTDLALALGMLVGVVSSQTYVQAMFAGRDVRASRRGAYLAAAVVIPSGAAGTLVGLYMRMAHPTTAPSQVLPAFILTYLPDWLGGLVLGGLLIALVGTGAGIVLGISTLLTKDLYRRVFGQGRPDGELLVVSRLITVAVAAASLLFAAGNLKSFILNWSFLSMGLRGCVVLAPLLGAVFFRKAVTPHAGMAATVAGPVVNLLWGAFGPKTVDPLYPGLLASAVALVGLSALEHGIGRARRRTSASAA